MENQQSNSWALILFLPDTMRCGIWEEIGRFIEAECASLLAATPVRLTPSLHASLYQETLAREVGADRLPTRWLLPSLFSLDMGIAVILRSARPNLQRRLGRVKGSARREGRCAGTIRSLSPLSERGLSLVHMPDSDAEAERQVALLFGPINPDNLLVGHAVCPANPACIGQLRGYVPFDRDASPWDLPARLIGRALATILWDPRLTVSAFLKDALHGLNDQTGCTLPRDTFRRIGAMVQEAAPPVPTNGTDLSTGRRLTERYGDMVSAILALSAPEALTMLDGPRIAQLFLRNDLFLDPWEQHVLSVFCAFPPS